MIQVIARIGLTLSHTLDLLCQVMSGSVVRDEVQFVKLSRAILFSLWIFLSLAGHVCAERILLH